MKFLDTLIFAIAIISFVSGLMNNTSPVYEAGRFYRQAQQAFIAGYNSIATPNQKELKKL